MSHRTNATFRQVVTTLMIAGTLCSSTGCATIAHRSSYSYPGKESATSCEKSSGVCPWLIGDALLLLPGVVPGVIAFIVDFSTGAWHHDNLAAGPRSTDRHASNSAWEGRRQMDTALFEADEPGGMNQADLKVAAQSHVGD